MLFEVAQVSKAPLALVSTRNYKFQAQQIMSLETLNSISAQSKVYFKVFLMSSRKSEIVDR
jgi:hypothetical protein